MENHTNAKHPQSLARFPRARSGRARRLCSFPKSQIRPLWNRMAAAVFRSFRSVPCWPEIKKKKAQTDPCVPVRRRKEQGSDFCVLLLRACSHTAVRPPAPDHCGWRGDGLLEFFIVLVLAVPPVRLISRLPASSASADPERARIHILQVSVCVCL